MNLYIIKYREKPLDKGFYLIKDNWNDYGYKTRFDLYYYDGEQMEEIGGVKIGTKESSISTTKDDILNNQENIFSLGTNTDYYSNLYKLGNDEKLYILERLNDIAHNLELFQTVQDYRVTQVSLMRGKFHKTVREQFHRIIKGQAVLTSYEFQFKKEDIKIDFQVNPNSNPPSNLHGIIGSNGVGKTRLLKDILNGFLDSQANYIINKDSKNSFYDDNIFTNALFISFSIFDTLEINQTQNKNFSYIGVKKNIDENGSKRNSNKNNDELADEFVNSIREIYNRNDESSERWSRFIEVLGLKNLFFELNKIEDNKKSFKRQFNKLSSGQKIVVLSITKMVERVVEKTLILLDEPELYLHPPLLASYMKVISTLLTEQNGVGIISTHSPVVMQELGKSNVNMIKSSNDNIYITKPRLETYGENLGTLTREVFGFEIENTGYYETLVNLVNEGYEYDDIIEKYKNSLGIEARSILRTLLKHKRIEQ